MNEYKTSVNRYKTAGSLTGGLVLIGLAILFLVDSISFWPWILAVIGVAILPGSIIKDGWRHSITGSAWLIGLALCFYFEMFWPGILILIGITLILEFIFPKQHKKKYKENIFDQDDDF
jgi:predicted membrane protein